MTTEEKYRTILRRHLPAAAVDRVYDWLQCHSVHFTVSRRRTSKLGDYRRPHPAHPFHAISVNGDLAPAMFLWVFLHEAAHLENRLNHPLAQPHGHQWQHEYSLLLAAYADAMPPEARPLIAQLTARIPLNRSLMRQIEALLQGNADTLRLDHLPPGSRFELVAQPGRTFLSLERRRTRWVCREEATGRTYLVGGQAEVQPLPTA